MNEKSEEDGAPPPPSLPHNHAYETLDEIVSVSLSLLGGKISEQFGIGSPTVCACAPAGKRQVAKRN